MKKTLIVLAALIVLGAAGYWFLRGRIFAITITQEQIQAQLDQKFPIDKAMLLVLKLTLQNPKVHLHEGSERIDFSVDALLTTVVEGKQLKGSAALSGLVRYDPGHGQFFFDDARVDDLAIAGLSERYHEQAVKLATLAVREYVQGKPLYTLDQADVKQSLAKLTLRSVRVVGGRLVVAMGL